jgi:hypothetical protein
MVKERSAKKTIRQSRIFPFGCPFWALPAPFFPVYYTFFYYSTKNLNFKHLYDKSKKIVGVVTLRIDYKGLFMSTALQHRKNCNTNV